MKISVLDQSTASADRTEDVSIRESLALAQFCDGLGYHRYWVSEHHNSGGIVGTAPEILLAGIAATTKHIRLGSAGVMLPHYASLKVAEQFRVLEALAPGRIDLGVGRAPGSDRLTAFALNPYAAQQGVDDFPAQVVELQAWTSDQPLPAEHPFANVIAHPRGPSSPDIWMLGSSDFGARLAAHLGMPYAFAYFFTDGRGVEQALALYRENFKPSERYPEPYATICVWALTADTQEEADHLYRSRSHWRVKFEQGVRQPLHAPEKLVDEQYTPLEIERMAQLRQRAFIGTPETVVAGLQELANELSLDELVINTWTYEAKPRQTSYQLLANAFGLTQPT